MGLLRAGINEVIATTSFNAAPMGIHYREGKAAMILFTGSHTAQNIERDGWVVANFVYDPVLYVKTAFEDLPGDVFLEEIVNGKKMHRLSEMMSTPGRSRPRVVLHRSSNRRANSLADRKT